MTRIGARRHRGARRAFVAAGAGAAGRGGRRRAVLPRAVRPRHDLRDRRPQPRSHPRLWRPGQLRPRRLSRHRRLCRRHPELPRHRQRLRAFRGGARRGRRRRGGNRLRVAAHHGRLLHHDHAGVQPDGLFPRRQPAPVRRRRRAEHRRATAISPACSTSPTRPSSTISCFAFLALFLFLGQRAVALALRHGAAGVRSNERRMLALGFPTFRYKLAAFVIAGARVRRRRRAVRQPDPVRLAVDHALDALRRDHDDGDPRRHRHAVRAGARRGGVPAAGRACCRAGPSIGRRSSGRC